MIEGNGVDKPQVIFNDGGEPAFAVLPWRDYESLVARDDATLTDEELYDLAAAAREESFPAAVVDRLLAGEHPVRVYRQHRGLAQKQLAEAAGIGVAYLSQIETGKRKGSANTLAAIARRARRPDR